MMMRWATVACWCGGYAGGGPFYLAGVEGTREVGHSILLVWRVHGRWAILSCWCGGYAGGGHGSEGCVPPHDL